MIIHMDFCKQHTAIVEVDFSEVVTNNKIVWHYDKKKV